jgi:hypothetical protein
MIELRRMRWAGRVVRMGGNRNAYRLLVGKSEGRRPLGKPRSRWVDNIKTVLVKIEWGCLGWIDPTQDKDSWRALVNIIMKFRVL